MTNWKDRRYWCCYWKKQRRAFMRLSVQFIHTVIINKLFSIVGVFIANMLPGERVPCPSSVSSAAPASAPSSVRHEDRQRSMQCHINNSLCRSRLNIGLNMYHISLWPPKRRQNNLSKNGDHAQITIVLPTVGTLTSVRLVLWLLYVDAVTFYWIVFLDSKSI